MTLDPEAAREALAAQLSAMKGHMTPDIYYGGYFEIDTYAGTEIVPADDIGRTVGTHVEAFADYLEGHPVDPDEVVEHREGWLARMSAAGYLDCTAWGVYESFEAAAQYLIDTFGDD